MDEKRLRKNIQEAVEKLNQHLPGVAGVLPPKDAASKAIEYTWDMELYPSFDTGLSGGYADKSKLRK